MVHSVSELIGAFGEKLGEQMRQCEKHGEYTSLLLGAGKSRPAQWMNCPTCLEDDQRLRFEAEQAEQAARWERDRMEAKIGRACIPARFAEKSFENYRAETPEQQKAVRVCREYASNFEQHKADGRCILMLGDVGTGKTHLAAAIANQVLRQTKHTVLYVTVSQMIRHVKGSFDRESDYNESDAYKAFATPSLLILDEIGVQNATEFELTALFEVVNWRYEDMLPTMVISNRGIDDLPKFMGDRVVDRLRENGGKLVVFDWKSERRSLKGAAQ